MNTLLNVNDLLIQQTRKLVDGEEYILETLPKIVRRITSTDLADFTFRMTDEKRRQLSRLGQVLKELEVEADGESSDGLRCLSNEKHMLMERSKSSTLDNAIISIYLRSMFSLQTNTYQVAISCAFELENKDVARLLRKCLREEQELEKQIITLEESFIDALANVPVLYEL